MILLGIDSALQGAEIRKGRTGQKECPALVNNFTHGHTGKSLKYCFCVKGLLLPALGAFPRQFVSDSRCFAAVNSI